MCDSQVSGPAFRLLAVRLPQELDELGSSSVDKADGSCGSFVEEGCCLAGFGDSLDGQAESSDWTFTLPLPPCSSLSLQPLPAAAPSWGPQRPLGSPPTCLRPMFPPLYQAPASPAERALPAFQDHFQGGGGQGPPQKSNRAPASPPPLPFQFCLGRGAPPLG